MTTIDVKCPIPGCEFSTGIVPEAVAVAVLNAHVLVHSSPSNGTNQQTRGEKLIRPKVECGITIEEWNVFERRWNLYLDGSAITDSQASVQLFQCASNDLGDALLKVDPAISKKCLSEVMAAMKELAVIPVETGVLRAELLDMRQKREEPFRVFATRVRGKAETCSFSAESKCECGRRNVVNYTEHIICDVLVSGIYDSEIRRHILGIDVLIDKSVNEVIALVERAEMARDANEVNASTSAMFARQETRQNKTVGKYVKPPPGFSDTPSAIKVEQIHCPRCKAPFLPFTKGRFGTNKKPHKMCRECHLSSKSDQSCKQANGSVSSLSGLTSTDDTLDDVISQISVIQTPPGKASILHQTSPLPPEQPDNGQTGENQSIRLSHHIFSSGEWTRAKFFEHPTMELSLSLNTAAYKKFSFKPPEQRRTPISAKLDSCAQSCLWSLQEFLNAGFTEADLVPVSLSLSAANHSRIPISGALFVQLSGVSCGKQISCQTMVYVSPAANGFYLSLEAMVDMQLVNRDSPLFPKELITPSSSSSTSGQVSSVQPCSCPKRGAVPRRPSSLPFAAVPENIAKMKEWLLHEFSSTTFNACPHHPIPEMSGPPIKIHIDENAKPRACHTPASVPLHWQADVRADLLRDEALGVIEKVPFGEPVTWCHRMVVTRKPDGSPRRTVDLSPLNKHCKRETFASESPFQIVRRIPKGRWKTVTDAWNGYHGVPLEPADRHLTTFVTPWGRYRYRRAPQGFVSSGDAYNRRYDAILADFHDKERATDDLCHHDDDLESHWWRTIDLLITLGKAGMVLNASKFQFCGRVVDFAGFRVGEDNIEPLPKYLDAIREFPSPRNISDVRSWFGLVNQVSNYAQLRDLMTPFKAFLSPRCSFHWNDDLEKRFIESKTQIIAAIREGVEIFDITKPTCLRPDWSKRGIGYFLSQKHCSCETSLPGCCENGWKVTLAGSRFLHGAEQRYAAVEGEALAVAWGLEQTKYFTQGCDSLRVVTDHKPLVKLLGDRTLDEITNSRLFRIKQRTLPWRYVISHMPGKTNLAADATSRHPSKFIESVGIGLLSAGDLEEIAYVSALTHHASDLMSISWKEIVDATSEDSCLCNLRQFILQGFPGDVKDIPPEIKPFWNVRDCLSITEGGVILYNDRVVVPHVLQKRILEVLHSAHQGVSGMDSRAQAAVYWPGMSADLQAVRNECTLCCKNAPSQPRLPTVAPEIPSTPFESVFADFFDVSSHHYLLVGDRLSGWVEVFSARSGSTQAGAAGLISHLRSLFATFGVPEKLSSDGGPEFKASATEDFLRNWGVQHRISSAHFPQSNGRAEVAVKKVKRFLISCHDQKSGSLNTDKFLRGILQIRNTPDPDCKVSPAQILFGRPIRDAFAFINRGVKFTNPAINPTWKQAWQAKEEALRVRFVKSFEAVNAHSKPLPELSPGDHVFIQNQVGQHPNKWDRSGVVVESKGHHQYLVKVDGTGRLSLRNRKFLRKFTLPQSSPSPSIPQRPLFAGEALAECPTTQQLGIRSPSQAQHSAPVGVSTEIVHPVPETPATPVLEASVTDEPNVHRAGDVPPDNVFMDPVSMSPDSMTSRLTTPSPADPQTASSRPKRQCRQPKVYVPEDGTWH